MMTDDHGDQFPGALPAPGAADPAHRAAADKRIVRMRADYLQKANSLVEAGRDDLAHELAASFAEEGAGAHTAARRSPGRHSPTRGQGGRRPETDTRFRRMSRLTRTSLDRFDRYTLDVFNSGSRYDRTER